MLVLAKSVYMNAVKELGLDVPPFFLMLTKRPFFARFCHECVNNAAESSSSDFGKIAI